MGEEAYGPFTPPDPFRVPCRFCGAVAGTQCRNVVTGAPVRRFLAHLVRVTDATAGGREGTDP